MKLLNKSKWAFRRIVGLTAIVTHPDGCIVALVPSTRGRSRFAGFTIAYLAPDTLDLMLVDTEKEGTQEQLEHMRKNGQLAVGDLENFTESISIWQKRNDFVTSEVTIELKVLETPGVVPVRAFPPVIIVEQPVVSSVAAPPIVAKKRKTAEALLMLDKRPTQQPVTLKEYVVSLQPNATTRLVENPSE